MINLSLFEECYDSQLTNHLKPYELVSLTEVMHQVSFWYKKVAYNIILPVHFNESTGHAQTQQNRSVILFQNKLLYMQHSKPIVLLHALHFSIHNTSLQTEFVLNDIIRGPTELHRSFGSCCHCRYCGCTKSSDDQQNNNLQIVILIIRAFAFAKSTTRQNTENNESTLTPSPAPQHPQS